jgi:TonB-linked SusC/RagA family outer membrane protein
MKITFLDLKNSAKYASLLFLFSAGITNTSSAFISGTTAGFEIKQDGTYKGLVTDTDKGVLPGVSVVVVGTKQATSTNQKGQFQLDNLRPGQQLKFSMVGYKDYVITLGSNKDLKIQMSTSDEVLNEVIVVGYGTQSKKTVTSAIGKIDGKNFENLPVNSVGDGMKGKVAGLRVYTTDNQPGENPTFRIRGGSSINQSDAPIIVVDGVVREISGLNPNDIASVEILKDAASAAIYGARASNGIVMITTKKGMIGKPTITFEAAHAGQQPAQQFDLMNAEDYITWMRKAVANGKYPERNYLNGYSMSSGNTESSIWTTRYLNSGEQVPNGWKSMLDPLDASKTLIFQDVDYQERFFKDSQWKNYYVGVNGGSEAAKYAASAGYTDDGGLGIGTGYDRFTMKGNMDIKITDQLNFSTGYDFSKTNLQDYPGNKRNSVQRGLSTPNTHRLYNSETGLPEKGINGSTPTPDWYEYYYKRAQVTKRITSFGRLDYKPIQDLKLTTMISNFNRHTRYSGYIKANEYNGLRETTENFSETNRLNVQAFGNYTKSFGEHNLDLVLGTEYTKDHLNGFEASVTGASSDKVPTLSAGAIPGMPTSSRTDEVLISYFGRANYNYKSRYLLSFTMRTDGSSKFAEGNRWGYFPAGSAGWIVSDEEFWTADKWFNNLKVRGSYGLTGNNAIGLFDAYGNYSTSGLYNGQSTIVTNTIPNRSLNWETTRQLDLGFDAEFLKNRISLSADYFNKITSNLIFDQPLPNTSGYTSITTNIGKVKFYGADLHLSTVNIKSPNFKWTTDLTYSYIMNRVLELPFNGNDRNRIGGITIADGSSFGGTAEGERMYRIYGYVVDHILETPGEAYGAMYDANSNGYRFSDRKSITGRKDVGDYEWKNRPGSSLRNGEDQINSDDQFLLGYTIPHTTGGIGNNFQYKNFSLNVFLDYAIGHTVQNYLQERYFMGTFNYNYNLTNEVKKTWQQPGDQTKYAKFFANDADDGNKNYSRVSNVFSEKGDYLCIREVTLAYNLPKKWLDKVRMTNASLYVSGNNLYYFTAVKGVSPERGVGSTYDTDYNPYPAARKVSLGVKVSF